MEKIETMIRIYKFYKEREKEDVKQRKKKSG